MEYRVTTLTYGEPEYAVRLAQIQSDSELVHRMWIDAESRPHELALAGTSWSITLVRGGGQELPAAWCAAHQIDDDGAPVLRCHSNYEVPAYRGHGLYMAAYQERHRRIIRTSALPAVTYLFAQPMGLHLADGWATTGLTGPGDLDGHQWWELRRKAAGTT